MGSILGGELMSNVSSITIKLVAGRACINLYHQMPTEAIQICHNREEGMGEEERLYVLCWSAEAADWKKSEQWK